jgi:hypothetical protein
MAARLLGISRRILYNRLSEYGVGWVAARDVQLSGVCLPFLVVACRV